MELHELSGLILEGQIYEHQKKQTTVKDSIENISRGTDVLMEHRRTKHMVKVNDNTLGR